MPGELTGKKVLIVDDDREILTAMQAALTDLGCEIQCALNGNQAVELIEAGHPDLVILDQMLPGRSGFLVMERVKKGKKPSDPPKVIMITGNLGQRHKSYAESLGVNIYINKPFRMEKLVEAVLKLMVLPKV